MTDTYQAQLDSPIGVLTLVASDKGLRQILWEDQAEDATPAETHPILAAASAQLAEYFAGDRVEFDLPLDLIGTDFRAIGAANGKNPVPIVLPCHRIVGADGSLTGFAGGLAMKQRLLALEQDQQSFDI